MLKAKWNQRKSNCGKWTQQRWNSEASWDWGRSKEDVKMKTEQKTNRIPTIKLRYWTRLVTG